MPSRVYPLMDRNLQLHAGVQFEGYTESGDDRRNTDDLEEAQVVTSKVKADDGSHYPLLDVDMPITPYQVARMIGVALGAEVDPWAVTILESSTPGHCHVYVDKVVAWEELAYILDHFVAAGTVEPGYASASKARGWTSLRLPWIRKEPAPADPERMFLGQPVADDVECCGSGSCEVCKPHLHREVLPF